MALMTLWLIIMAFWLLLKTFDWEEFISWSKVGSVERKMCKLLESRVHYLHSKCVKFGTDLTHYEQKNIFFFQRELRRPISTHFEEEKKNLRKSVLCYCINKLLNIHINCSWPWQLKLKVTNPHRIRNSTCKYMYTGLPYVWRDMTRP
jgi:hypothetical protein